MSRDEARCTKLTAGNAGHDHVLEGERSSGDAVALSIVSDFSVISLRLF